MERLTTDHPEGNFETVLNFVYGKDGAAYFRTAWDRDGVPVHEWAKKQCIARGCDDFPGETLEEIDEIIFNCPQDCPVHLAYIFACQAVHLRGRLKMYEDTGLMPEEITAGTPPCYKPDGDGCAYQVYDGDDEPIDRCKECPLCYSDKQRHQSPPNTPLTLEKLDGEPVVLPCKVGDLVYEVDNPEYGVITCRVLYIDYYTGPAGHVPGNPMVSTISIGVEVICGHGKGSSYCFEQEDIGKLVFLTLQEAEAILAHRRKPEEGVTQSNA